MSSPAHTPEELRVLVQLTRNDCAAGALSPSEAVSELKRLMTQAPPDSPAYRQAQRTVQTLLRRP